MSSRLLPVVVLATLTSALACSSYETESRSAPPADSPALEPVAAAPATPSDESEATEPQGGELTTAVEPKGLSRNAKTGLAWLVQHQLASGAWGQGDESPQMRRNGAAGGANVADTSMALLALMRSGSSPNKGIHKKSVAKGIEYVLAQIEASDDDSLWVTEARGTRVQSKIGTYVDTFTGLLALTEAKGKMPTKAGNQRLDAAVAKVMAKIEKNQHQDGTWSNEGWAPALSQSVAAKGLNRAAQRGVSVDRKMLRRVETHANKQYDKGTGKFAKKGSAGVALYSSAGASASMRDSVNTRRIRKKKLQRIAKRSKDKKARKAAEAEIRSHDQAEKKAETAERALLGRLDDPSFIRGFGNNGGEEFLSYLLVSESLVVKGGEDWQAWDKSVTGLINGVQNEDGSWTGHHCITGRTFCTAAALMVLMADRTPVPVAAKLRG